MSKISGPLMDRIDIHIEVPAVPYDELAATGTDSITSEQMRGDVTIAREAQVERFAGTSTRYNTQMSSREVRKYCELTSVCRKMLKHSVEELGLSARAHDKVLWVARTIADVAGSKDIEEAHLGEAINYRSLDANLWT